MIDLEKNFPIRKRMVEMLGQEHAMSGRWMLMIHPQLKEDAEEKDKKAGQQGHKGKFQGVSRRYRRI